MFDQYAYLNSILPVITEIKAVKRISGLRELEEVLENLRGLQYPLILAEDKGDGFLSLGGRNLDNGYHSFYLVSKVKLENSGSRVEVQALCMALGKKVFKQMLADGVNFGDAAYGFDTSRIDYQRVGPLIDNYHGYSFSYIIKDENFNL